MVVERNYANPRMDPTDLLTFSGALIPVSDPDYRLSERVIVVLSEPLDGLLVHTGLSKNPGQVEITLYGQKPVVYVGDEFKFLGVVVVRRTLYRSSVIRTWLQRNFGVIKDEQIGG